MDIERDLSILTQQKDLLHFQTFGPDQAWQLGSLLRSKLVSRGAKASVEIELAGHLLFACATAGAVPGQANWIRRKRNTVHHFAQNTYHVGRELERDGKTLMTAHGLPEVDYAAHGGGFPILLQGGAMVGSVVLSGLPQREDHNIVVDGLADLLAIDVPRLR